MQLCRHCCPTGEIIDRPPKRYVKSLQPELDRYSATPTEPSAAAKASVQAGLLSVWGYKTAQLIKMLGISQRSHLESMLLGLQDLPNVEIYKLKQGEHPHYKNVAKTLRATIRGMFTQTSNNAETSQTRRKKILKTVVKR